MADAADSRAETAAKKWEAVQKKAFTHWVNQMLKKRDIHIELLEEGLQSGVNLIHLVEILTGKSIAQKWTRRPKLRVHKITNCFIALKHLQENGVPPHLITIAAEDLVNGDRISMLLGFCWVLLRNFQELPTGGTSGSADFEASLLAWVKETLSDYKDLNFDSGFRSDAFRNGKAFLGLINEFDSKFVDYKSYKAENKMDNLKAAFEIADSKMNVPTLIDYVEMANGQTSDKNVVLYLSLFYNAFKEKTAGAPKEALQRKIKELEEQLRILLEENSSLKLSTSELLSMTTELEERIRKLTEERQMMLKSKDEFETQLSTLREQFETEKRNFSEESADLRNKISQLGSSADEELTKLQNSWEDISNDRDKLKEELKQFREEMAKEKESLLAKQEELKSNLSRQRKVKEDLEAVQKESAEAHKLTTTSLKKHLPIHIRDLNVWKGFLEQDREYVTIKPVLPTEAELNKLDFEHQINTLDKCVIEENARLATLLKEREIEMAEIVSVNMGKKKKRIKKEAEMFGAQPAETKKRGSGKRTPGKKTK